MTLFCELVIHITHADNGGLTLRSIIMLLCESRSAHGLITADKILIFLFWFFHRYFPHPKCRKNHTQNIIPKISGIHSGASTQTQLQAMTPVSFSTTKTTKSTSANPIPAIVLFLIRITPFFLHFRTAMRAEPPLANIASSDNITIVLAAYAAHFPVSVAGFQPAAMNNNS